MQHAELQLAAMVEGGWRSLILMCQRMEMSMSTDPKHSPDAAEARDVYRLTHAEIEAIRENSRKSSEWAKAQLLIDPELKHLGPPGGWPDTEAMDEQSHSK
ncbi:hypothetical protein RHOFW104T7_15780 [Rhodanobacter thiooxydans]|uniref:Uncharacterized protein n=1 Tax=Rhodanobacter thiooxydans TaxID=416169 RepID=A0A154QFP6_9GAMM|nr:hypothetical protein [Rhodanobacter thiooxydans]EIL98256.1 hypothetical protein UUA_12348 [Rhodanobacter thiooxydans LCS2]KZC23005.1 hypothetical protein RHOFW104T7_15780 [Rhodanobacter thiooxydans]